MYAHTIGSSVGAATWQPNAVLRHDFVLPPYSPGALREGGRGTKQVV